MPRAPMPPDVAPVPGDDRGDKARPGQAGKNMLRPDAQVAPRGPEPLAAPGEKMPANGLPRLGDPGRPMGMPGPMAAGGARAADALFGGGGVPGGLRGPGGGDPGLPPR